MNRYHQRRCRSPEWAAHMAGTVLPRALDGLALGTEVLELGPGYGATTRPLMERAGPGAAVTALEKDPELARRLRAGLDGRARVVTGDATGMPFGAGEFTAVVCFTMLHHLPSAAAQDQMFAEAARVLRPGGVFAGVDSLRSLRFRLIHLADTCTPVDPATLPARLTAAGFEGARVADDGRRLWFRAYTPGGPA
jgi:SAM-dependent methyltransferase